MASTFGGIVAHVSSESITSESVHVTEKIVEDNEESKIDRIFMGSKHPKHLIFCHKICSLLVQSFQIMCAFLLS